MQFLCCRYFYLQQIIKFIIAELLLGLCVFFFSIVFFYNDLSVFLYESTTNQPDLERFHSTFLIFFYKVQLLSVGFNFWTAFHIRFPWRKTCIDLELNVPNYSQAWEIFSDSSIIQANFELLFNFSLRFSNKWNFVCC